MVRSDQPVRIELHNGEESGSGSQGGVERGGVDGNSKVAGHIGRRSRALQLRSRIAPEPRTMAKSDGEAAQEKKPSAG